MSKPPRFCVRCGGPLALREPAPGARDDGARARLGCAADGCGHVHYDNPVPVVAAVLEVPEGVVLVRNADWPPRMFGLPAGFLEAREDPALAIVREIREELSLEATNLGPIGVYPFEMMNQIILAYHLRAEGPIALSPELAEFKIVPLDRLRGWPVGTGPAVDAFIARRALGLSTVLVAAPRGVSP